MMAKTKLGGIFGSFMSDEYLKQHGLAKEVPDESDETPASQPAPRATSKTPASKSTKAPADDFTFDTEPTVNTAEVHTMSTTEEGEMREKLHGLLVKMSKPGTVDFIKVWDSVLEMEGGATPANIKNAYNLLNKMSAQPVTPDFIAQTCDEYTANLQNAIDANVQQLKDTKQKMITNMANEKESLTQKVADLNQQINDLNTQRAQAETDLANVGAKYSPDAQKIDRRVIIGQKMTAAVITEMKNFLSVFQSVIK
jgi:hypothetical protein